MKVSHASLFANERIERAPERRVVVCRAVALVNLAKIELTDPKSALESCDGIFDRTKEMVRTELFEECASLQVMVNQMRRAGNRDRHPALFELEGKAP